MIPLRYVGEALNLKVEWDGETKTAYLASPEQDEPAEKNVEEPVAEEAFSEQIDPFKGLEDPVRLLEVLADEGIEVGFDLESNSPDRTEFSMTKGNCIQTPMTVCIGRDGRYAFPVSAGVEMGEAYRSSRRFSAH